MKNLIFKNCAAMLTICLLSQSYAQAIEAPSIKEQPPVTTNAQQATPIDYSAQIQAHITNLNNKKIQYVDGKVLIFADASKLDIAALGAASLVFLAGGGIYTTSFIKNPSINNISSLCGAFFFSTLGITGSIVTIEALRKRLRSKPIFVIDKDGLVCEEKRVLEWKNIERIATVQYEFNQHDIYFQDKSDKTIFELSGNYNALSPETLLQMLEIIKFYRNQANSLPIETPFTTTIKKA
jgi:hypothetical protein